METFKVNMLNIPIGGLSRVCNHFPKYWFSSAFLQFLHEGEKKSFIGHGIAENKDFSQKIACYELLERFLGTFYPQENRLVSLCDYFTNKEVEQIDLFDLLYEVPASFTQKSFDTKGLAYHHSIENAKEGALRELVEKYVINQVWFFKKWNFVLLKQGVEAGFTISYYTLDIEKPIPFVLAIIENIEQQVWVAGRGLGDTFVASMEKAKKEAIMFLHSAIDFQQNPQKYDFNALSSSQKMVVSFASPISIERKKHLATCTIPNKIIEAATREYTDKEILENIGILPENTYYSVLFQESEHIVVRVLHHELRQDDFLIQKETFTYQNSIFW